MQVLLRTAFHLSRLRGTDGLRVVVLVDKETGVRADTVASSLRPWRTWLDVTEILVSADPPADSWVRAVAEGGAQVVAMVSERQPFVKPIAEAATVSGLRTVYSGYETGGPHDAALFHEMAHHHYELGGLNEWDGAPVQYAIPVLQNLSAVNCIRHFPAYMIERLRSQRAQLGRPVEALDVGSGSISRLRWGALQGLIHITGVDPLLELYDLVLAHHGLDQLPSIRVDRAISANAENLERHVAADSFEFAYCCNALDHVQDPAAVVAQIARALRPGGVFALQFATREGSRQGWRQLHRFDLFLDPEGGQLICERPDGRRSPLVSESADLQIAEVVLANDDYTVAVLARPESARR